MPIERDCIQLTENVLKLFGDSLRGVRFPDLDAEVLAADLARVQQAHTRTEELVDALDMAQRLVKNECEKLTTRVERTLAYLRVYAEDKPELSAQLEALPAMRDKLELVAAPAPRRRPRAARSSSEAVTEPQPLGDSDSALPFQLS